MTKRTKALGCVHKTGARVCKSPATRVPLNYGNNKPVRDGGWAGEAWCDRHAPVESQPDPVLAKVPS